MRSYHIVSPAYGRDYKNETLARNDFLANKDFVYEVYGVRGRYCSIRDFKSGDKVEIRFNKKNDLTMLTI
jgi:hypothetical protein